MHNKPSAAAKPDELPNNSENQTPLLAHQLRNSLNGMMLRLELLGREVGEGGSKHLEETAPGHCALGSGDRNDAAKRSHPGISSSARGVRAELTAQQLKAASYREIRN